jgi:hypothetical protein
MSALAQKQTFASPFFLFKIPFGIFVGCISDGPLERGRHGRRAWSIYPGGPTLSLNQADEPKSQQLSYCAKRTSFGSSLEPQTKLYDVAELSLKKFRLNFNGLFGGRTRTRTWDPLIKSQLIARLRARVSQFFTFEIPFGIFVGCISAGSLERGRPRGGGR